MNRIISAAFAAILMITGMSNAQYGQCKLSDKPDGFASIEGGTTGGEGGPIVTVTNASELDAACSDDNPRIVVVSGSISISGFIRVNNNKTIIGLGDNAKITGGGLDTYGDKNIIIRNITFVNGPEDLIKLQSATQHVWIDHCTFCDSEDPSYDSRSNTDHDGTIDITKKSNYVTISWCKFYNHDKNILIGHSDGSSDDVGFLKTTLHHNWFNKVVQRSPRVRYGEVHCYNNVYDSNLIYGVGSACEAKVLVEGCRFAYDTVPLDVQVAESDSGNIVQINNIFVECGSIQTRGTAFDPKTYYTYTADDPASMASVVRAKSGAGSGTAVAVKIPLCKSVAKSNFVLVSNEKSIVLKSVSAITSKVEVTLFNTLGKRLNSTVSAEISFGKPLIIPSSKSSQVRYAVVKSLAGTETIRIE